VCDLGTEKALDDPEREIEGGRYPTACYDIAVIDYAVLDNSCRCGPQVTHCSAVSNCRTAVEKACGRQNHCSGTYARKSGAGVVQLLYSAHELPASDLRADTSFGIAQPASPGHHNHIGTPRQDSVWTNLQPIGEGDLRLRIQRYE